MSLKDLFDDPDPSSLLIDNLDSLQSNFAVETECEAMALRLSSDTARWSANQNPSIAVHYCRDLGWTPHDLAAMMVMQCAISSATSGEFSAAQGVLTSQGEGFRLVVERCLEILVESGRISKKVADIELRELDAEIEETVPSAY